ncbi:succinate dehydrogenase, cytochrome b556 subunit [Gammaproteobacteria bacterium]|nr:succinate dehydrogenase, cytochrome b556 subunit [Gammaproteobacteria bacterium]
MSQSKRPLSPFMLGQDYKLQASSVMSFLHRASGIAFILILIVIGSWIVALARGPVAFAQMNVILTHIAFLPFLIAGAAAACYHFCNGIRHLLWDLSIGLDINSAKKSANIVTITSIILTITLVLAGYLS